MQNINKILFSPLFIWGCALRLLFVVIASPIILSEWYLPFLSSDLTQFSIDPWSSWLISGGAPEAFPYGYGMWVIFMPLMILGKFIGINPEVTYFTTIFLVDLFLCWILLNLLKNNTRLVLVTYWLSPIIIILIYGLGLNDIVPAAFLMLSVLFLKENKIFLSSAALIFSISAKLSMLVALPFFIIYVFNTKSHRHRLQNLILSLSFFGILFGLPFIISNGAMDMLFGNEEMGKIFDFAITLGDSSIYIVPLIYFFLLYLGWRVRPLNFELFTILVAASLLMIVLLTPSSPGWFIWAIPFLIMYQSRGDKTAFFLTFTFSLVYLIQTLYIMPINFIENINYYFNKINLPNGILSNLMLMLLNTSIFALGSLIAIRMWRDEITRSDFYRFNKNPLVIGISGDSGSGKDTLSDSLEGLIGSHSTVKLSGDDYHRWDRHKPMWQVMTHINPMANDLQSFSNDLINLIDGKSINQRHYDHKTGKMTKHFKVKSNQFILASGLHTFSLPMVRQACNLKIFLNIDEELRRFFKIRRDVHERGHSIEKVISSIELRMDDSKKFISTQASYADVILSLKPLNRDMLKNYESLESLRFKLSAKIRNSYNEMSLQRVLVGICGLHVDLVTNSDGSEIEMIIEGESTAEDIEQAALLLSPRTIEYLDEKPQWEDGISGIMQIIIFSQISQLITKNTT